MKARKILGVSREHARRKTIGKNSDTFVTSSQHLSAGTYIHVDRKKNNDDNEEATLEGIAIFTVKDVTM